MFKMWILTASVVLLKCTIDDIKYKSININVLFAGSVFAILWALFYRFLPTSVINEENVYEAKELILLCLMGAIPGVILIVISSMKKGLGIGDSYLITFLGCILGLNQIIDVITVSFVLSFIFSLYLMKSKGVKKEYDYPFVPFISAGFILCMIIKILIKKQVSL